MATGITTVFGGYGTKSGPAFPTTEALVEMLDVLEKGGCDIIDTAEGYGDSEERLGKAGAGKRFTIDTKHPGGLRQGSATTEGVVKSAERSRKLLGTNVDVYYLHAPDPDIPIEETLEGINQVYKTGFFQRFGLSNFTAEEVQKIYDICKAKGYPLPQVYQGNYSAVTRKQEEVLFPALRKLGISFYAYSPLAGGFLTKTRQDIIDGKGRFDPSAPIGSLYRKMYDKPAYLEVLDKWEKIATDEGVTRAALANRWVKYHSPLKRELGDGLIIGPNSIARLQETLDSINKGPLSDKAVKAIDDAWDTVKHEAPLDNYHG